MFLFIFLLLIYLLNFSRMFPVIDLNTNSYGLNLSLQGNSCKSLNSSQIRENTKQKNATFGRVLRSFTTIT